MYMCVIDKCLIDKCRLRSASCARALTHAERGAACCFWHHWSMHEFSCSRGFEHPLCRRYTHQDCDRRSHSQLSYRYSRQPRRVSNVTGIATFIWG